jgi:Kef-type K+ transport system membrane component KefB
MLEDPILTAMGLALVWVSARFGGRLAQRIGQPAVLGELLMGVALGQLSVLDAVANDPALTAIAELGVMLLLFEVGLESTVHQMLRVGASALAVALIGVITPFALGVGVGLWLVPSASIYAQLFLGAALTATSVGITARVLSELGKSDSDEARVIIGAAVIDDVLGLLVLSIMTAIVAAKASGSELSALQLGFTLVRALVFLAVAVVAGSWLSPRLFALTARSRWLVLATGLAVCFGLAFGSHAIGLAAIVGAFVAGLVIEPTHYTARVPAIGGDPLHALVRPISKFVAPVFFVLTGMHTKLGALGEPQAIVLAGALAAAAVLGKQLCYFGVRERGLDRLSIALGMIPRGEVGLIFASAGLALQLDGKPVLDDAAYVAVVAMVLCTTLLTPPALKWSLARSRA